MNVREYRRGNQAWTIQRNWQLTVHKSKKNKTKTQHKKKEKERPFMMFLNCILPVPKLVQIAKQEFLLPGITQKLLQLYNITNLSYKARNSYNSYITIQLETL